MTCFRTILPLALLIPFATSAAAQDNQQYVQILDSMPPNEAYSFLYKTIQEVNDDSRLISISGLPDGYIEMIDCGGPELLGVGGAEGFPEYYTIAAEIAMDQQFWRSQLGNSRYPKEVWQNEVESASGIAIDVIDFGRKLKYLPHIPKYYDVFNISQGSDFIVTEYELSLFEGDDTKYSIGEIDPVRAIFSGKIESRSHDLYEALRSYIIKEKKWRLPPPGYGGCGAGEFGFVFKTNPPGGHVLYIPTFDLKLCSALKVDPFDRSRCTAWKDAVQTYEYLSGKYSYRVKWPDGKIDDGSFEAYGPGVNGENNLSITINKSGNTASISGVPEE